MDLVPFARRLRRQMSEAEQALWYHLRARRLAGLKFRRQVPIGPYIVDFLCPEHRLVVEIDGGQHNYPSERAHDAERTKYLESQGYRLLRFWNNEVLTNLEAVLEVILAACRPPHPRPQPPHPNPLPQGEGKRPSPFPSPTGRGKK